MFTQTRGFASFRRAARKAWLITIALSLLTFTVALAASGDLDITFHGDGKVTTDISGEKEDEIWGIGLQADDKIVVVGWREDPVRAKDFAVVRYKANGSLDTTFSGDGKLLTNFGAIDYAGAVAIQPDGKIVAAGMRCLDADWPNWNCDVALARYKVNGALDTTFSGDGKVTTDFDGRNNGLWHGLAIQPDGKIVIGGWMWNGADFDFTAYRYNPNGTLDTTFSGDGKVNIGFAGGPHDIANGFALQPDGKILVSGPSCDTERWENCDFAIMRLKANGSLDTTFSGDGRQTINFGSNDGAHGIIVQPNGKIVLFGEKISSTGSACALARINSNGSLDKTFSGDGKVVMSFGSGIDTKCRDARVQTNGKIVVVGDAGGDFALARFNANGTLDTTFSTDGKMTIDFGGDDDYGQNLVLQSNGRYVLAGYSLGNFALARVLP